MKTYRPQDSNYQGFLASINRRATPQQATRSSVEHIIHQVETHGDQALVDFALQFDKVSLSKDNLFVSPQEMEFAVQQADHALKEAVAATLANIRLFASQSLRKDWNCVNHQGVSIGERFAPYRRVGVYVPGGKAPLVSTALMTAGFASAAGVEDIVAATPCNSEGKVNAALLYALHAAGVKQVLKIGGAQAIAALALGTESVAAVDKIVGPGNRFVVEAKRQLVGAVSIDLLPGPSEVLVLADDSADARFVAADLLAQAEHGGDSVAGLISTSAELIAKVQEQIRLQAATLSRGSIIEQVLADGAWAIQAENLQQAIALVNDFAPEHLSLCVEGAEVLSHQLNSCGAIYIGNYSAVAVGDFLAGPSHTLPTGGAGKSFSGLRADQFQRRTSIVSMNRQSVAASVDFVNTFGEVEGLDAHSRSVSIRLQD